MVLPYIKMNLPQVYMCSLSWTLLPPPSPYHPSGSSQCTSPKHPVSCIESGGISKKPSLEGHFRSIPPKLLSSSSPCKWPVNLPACPPSCAFFEGRGSFSSASSLGVDQGQPDAGRAVGPTGAEMPSAAPPSFVLHPHGLWNAEWLHAMYNWITLLYAWKLPPHC